MVRIDDLRRKQRKNLFFEIFFYIFFLLRLQFFKTRSADSVLCQMLLDLRISLIPFFIKRRHRVIDRIQLLPRRHPGTAVSLLIVHRSHIVQTSHADHKELIQIACKNRYKFHPLQKRHTLILRFFQHSLIKTKPG